MSNLRQILSSLHTASTISIFKSLQEGDLVEVQDKAGKTRTVRVTSIKDSPSNISAYTTSGKVRPNHFRGGQIALWKRDDSITFQPTLQQQSNPVLSLRIISQTH